MKVVCLNVRHTFCYIIFCLLETKKDLTKNKIRVEIIIIITNKHKFWDPILINVQVNI